MIVMPLLLMNGASNARATRSFQSPPQFATRNSPLCASADRRAIIGAATSEAPLKAMNFLRFRARRVPVERMIVPPIGADADPTTLHASFAVSLGGVLTVSELLHLRPQRTAPYRRTC